MNFDDQNSNLVFVSGGLGNQLFQFTAAINYFGEANFSIIPSSTFSEFRLSRKFSLNGLNLKERVIWKPNFSRFRLRLIRFFLVNENLRFKKLVRPIDSLIKTLYLVATSIIGKPQVAISAREIQSDRVYSTNPKFSRILVGYFQSMSIKKVDKALPSIKQLFEIPNLIGLEDHQEAKILRPLVVHVRMGDYANDDRLNILPRSYYSLAVKAAIETGKFKSIWLFSDGGADALAFIPTEYLGMTHLITKYLDSDIRTLELMRIAAGFVIGNSTLSWWAATLKYEQDAPVYSPAEWFRNTSINHPPNFPTWNVI